MSTILQYISKNYNIRFPNDIKNMMEYTLLALLLFCFEYSKPNLRNLFLKSNRSKE